MTDARYLRPSSDHSIPRGFRNCNPLNIDRGRDPWLGMTRDQSQDDRFIVFEHPMYGFRAAAKLLLNYQEAPRGDHAKLHTIGEIINRWAPPSENVTSAYASAVANAVGVGVDERIAMLRDDPNLLAMILRAMCEHENGVPCPYDDDVIVDAMKLAGVTVHTPPKEPSTFASGFDQDISQ